MKIFCKSGSGSQPHGKVPGRKKPERAQVHKKSKMFFKKRVLQLQKWQKMRVLRVLRVLFVLRVLRALRALRALGGVHFARKNYRVFGKAPSQGVGSRAENYVPIKIFSHMRLASIVRVF